MVMTAYIDESGTHGDNSPVLIVAGFLASVDRWTGYEIELRSLMAENEVNTFHATDLRRTKGDFKGWPRKRKAEFNTKLLQLADQHLERGLSVTLKRSDYEKIYRSTQFPRKVRADTEYGLCFRVFVWSVLHHAEQWKDHWPINLVLEDGHRNSGDAIRVYGEEKRKYKLPFAKSLGSISFSSKECLPLAAADHLAYHMFRRKAGFSAETKPNVLPIGDTYPSYVAREFPITNYQVTADTLSELSEDLWKNMSLRPPRNGLT